MICGEDGRGFRKGLQGGLIEGGAEKGFREGVEQTVRLKHKGRGQRTGKCGENSNSLVWLQCSSQTKESAGLLNCSLLVSNPKESEVVTLK